MRANLKITSFILLITLPLAGCGTVLVREESPESWGDTAGRYGAEQWIEQNGKSSWPSTDSVAAYCVTTSESGQKEFSWTIEELFQATDSCSKAFVDGLAMG
jgi:hypothetical protein